MPRILGAVVIAGVLIGGAYLLSNPSLFAPSAANAQSTQALLQAYAEQKGSNGLPLWENQLMATASSTAWATTTSDITMAPAPIAASGTLTDQFAQNLFTQYMQQEGNNTPSDQDINSFAQSAIQSLVQQHSQQDTYTEANLKVAGTGPAALKAYAAAVEQVVSDNEVPSNESELDYFADAIEKNQTAGLKVVASIGSSYTALAPALIAISVPSEAQKAHLEMANAFARMGSDITDMSTYESDPLRAYLGLSAYETDAGTLASSFSDMAAVFNGDQVTLTSQDSGYDFYNTAIKAANFVSQSGTNNSQ
ncbi:MAG: hypothetical protein P4M11_06405 [Candidatus Pacebacteria bacterium]|nr:hypothetical protein [Candidatus Paceibacterota bacterium]